MSSVAVALQNIRKNIPHGVALVCVSKFHPAEAVQEAYNCGERLFGESRVQELTAKAERLPKDIQWHFIGHLQSNKIKYIAPFVSMIHGVDSYKLLVEINKAAQKVGRTIDCLLQIHIAQEETKFGFSAHEVKEMLQQGEWKSLAHVRLCGLMGMATFTDNQLQVAEEFTRLTSLFNEVKALHFANQAHFAHRSIGMSDDYGVAIQKGSTMVRIGSSIFGTRA